MTNGNHMTQATSEQLETLRNVANVAEKLGFTSASQSAFLTYSKARTGQASQEEVNARTHGTREIIRTYHGSLVADSIA